MSNDSWPQIDLRGTCQLHPVTGYAAGVILGADSYDSWAFWPKPGGGFKYPPGNGYISHQTGKGKSSSNMPFLGGYVSSLEGMFFIFITKNLEMIQIWQIFFEWAENTNLNMFLFGDFCGGYGGCVFLPHTGRIHLKQKILMGFGIDIPRLRDPQIWSCFKNPSIQQFVDHVFAMLAPSQDTHGMIYMYINVYILDI